MSAVSSSYSTPSFTLLLKHFPKQEKVLVVHKNPAATAVAEIIDESLAYSVIDYNHHLLKGDIAKKKAILLALGSDLEP